MITEDYVSFEVAKLLKEKGFDDICSAFWKDWNSELHLCDCSSSSHVFEFCHNSMLENYNDEEETNIAAPTLQMAMKWLRETFEIHCQIDCPIISNWRYGIRDLNQDEWVTLRDMGDYETYEEACEEAIKYCLENLI